MKVHKPILLATSDDDSLIENAHGQYLWIGNDEGHCHGTLDPTVPLERAKIEKLLQWCTQLLSDSLAKRPQRPSGRGRKKNGSN